MEIELENENDINQQNIRSGTNTPENFENDEDILQLTNRKDVLNTVLEKLIDTINQPKKDEKIKPTRNQQNQ